MGVSADFRTRLLELVAAGLTIFEIRPLLAAELERGVSREKLYQELLDTILFLREQGREAEEDRVADVADLMSDWVPREYRL
ncbi:hypothetical protein AB0E55_37130 [Amycolatopsis keratiniphila]|uniref:Uncharacterized protein n=1 Tax=Amycolatopsis keratiniphila TaxID=129921 RepID=R4SJ49_9PSEU|nr:MULTISPECIES: hypothetical protein [Amycolatopsis]AGM02845.1 hypothetical protein AORI_0256 [Amycolatopsis keratiniphila]RSN37121.1 hypothetical protein DMC61_03360 [Amycolatopsis sp. WAC 04169]